MQPDTLPPLGNTLDFMRLLWSLAHGLQSRSKRMEADLGITGPQRLVIRILGRSPGASAGTLARAMCVHPSTLTGVLKRLEKQRLIERTRDQHDGRRALLILSAKGKKLDANKSGTIEGVVRRCLETLPASQVHAASALLRTLAEYLDPEPPRKPRRVVP